MKVSTLQPYAKEWQPMMGKKVKVFAGASGAAVMKGITASRGNVFVKVWCGLKGGYKQTPLHGGAVQVESS
jgi:hypothetical protein